jgi:hypothetical protein
VLEKLNLSIPQVCIMAFFRQSVKSLPLFNGGLLAASGYENLKNIR